MRIVRAGGGVLLALGAAFTCGLAARAEEPDAAKIAAGETVYINRCQVCHGDNLVSTGQTFDLRRLTACDRVRFDGSVRNGKNQMPPWQGVLSDEEIDTVWHYIRSHAYQP